MGAPTRPTWPTRNGQCWSRCYHRRSVGEFEDWVQTHLGWRVVVVRKLAEQVGFRLLPVRWRVERTLAWLGRNHRLANDYEELAECSEAHLYLASIKLLLRRLIPRCG